MNEPHRIKRSSPAATGDFVQLMISCQSRLYAFILSLVCDPDRANDVLQETNLVLWNKSDQFRPGTNFSAWAFKIARFQVMAHRQRLKRDRHVFDDDVVANVAASFERQADDFDGRLTALSHCMNELPDDARHLLHGRYADRFTVKKIAQNLGQTANRVAVRLHRLRVTLMNCIRRRELGGEST